MAIYNQRKFESSLAAGFDGFFDWDFLLPAFEGTKIQPMDFDCVVERNGCFLVFETKNNDDVEIPMGQVITLESAVKNCGWVIIVLRGKSASEIHGWEVWYRDRGGVAKEDFRGNCHSLVSFVLSWFEWASISRRGAFNPNEHRVDVSAVQAAAEKAQMDETIRGILDKSLYPLEFVRDHRQGLIFENKGADGLYRFYAHDKYTGDLVAMLTEDDVT